jgi:hypothetical protein
VSPLRFALAKAPLLVGCLVSLAGVATVAASASTMGCASTSVSSPRGVLRAYADALSDGRADDAYRMLSEEARRGITLEAFRVLVKQNKSEAIELGKSLGRPTEDPYVTATVPLASGEVLTLVLEDGRWKVDGAALDFYSQATPRQAIVGFLRAFSRRRWDVLLKYTPDAHKDGLTEDRLKAAWGEGKPEGKRVEEIVEAIKQSLPTSTIEETGDRATMVYGSAGTVLMVREQGAWKIEDLR